MSNDDVVLSLTSDEALVLFDWLHRGEDNDTVAAVEHHGEQVALWHLSCLLERILVEPFASDYKDLVSAARERLAASG